jgi:hypothetical protein
MHQKKANRRGSKKRGGSRRSVSSRRSVEQGVSSRRERVIISRGKSRHAKSRHAKSRHAMRGGDTKTKVAAAVVAATGLAISASYYKNHVLLKQKLTRSFDTFKELEWEKIVELLGYFNIPLNTNLLDKVQEEFAKVKNGNLTSTKVVDHPYFKRFLPKQKDNYNDFFKYLIVEQNLLYTHMGSQSGAGAGVMKSAGMISLSSTGGNVVSISTNADASAHTAERTIILLLLLWYYFDCSFTTLFLKEHFKLQDQKYTQVESGEWGLRPVSIVPNTLRFAKVINSIDFNSFTNKYKTIMYEDEFNTYVELKTKLENENKPQLDCLKKFNLNQELERDEYD